jgi:hypothetical protein
LGRGRYGGRYGGKVDKVAGGRERDKDRAATSSRSFTSGASAKQMKS